MIGQLAPGDLETYFLHDLKNPFHALKYCFEELKLLVYENSDSSRLETLLARMNHSMEEIEQLFRVFPQLSRRNAGETSVSETMDINREIAGLLEEFLPHLKAKKLSVNFDHRPLMDVIGNRYYLTKLVLRNLLSNAVFFSPSNTSESIVIQTQQVCDDFIQLKISNPTAPTKTQTIDNHSKIPGWGTGLKVAKQVAKILGGNLFLPKLESNHFLVLLWIRTNISQLHQGKM